MAELAIAEGAELANGRYRLFEEIGRGGMGRVFRAYDKDFHQDVALKTINAAPGMDLAAHVLSIKNEFHRIESHRHPNLVKYYNLFDSPVCFLTMELVKGENLANHVWQRPRFPGLSDNLDGRLRSLIPQMIDGVCFLHAIGQVHRDIKPSNLMVDDAGRLVILDFGLTTTRAHLESSLTYGVGTRGFWAPEQLHGLPCSSSDWYSIGATLYYLLTGSVLPPRTRPSTPGEEWEPLVVLPPDYRDVLGSLLAFESDQRGGAEALARLSSRPRSTAVALETIPFVGRQRELEQLRASLEVPESSVVIVSGESGIGKSELVEQFFSSYAAARCVLLRSRCRPNELVQHRGIDALIDDLARHLEHLSPTDALRIQPRGMFVGPLLTQFPTLQAVSLLRSVADEKDHLQPLDIHRYALAGLRELLVRLSDIRQIVLWIDDAQWGDLDSLVVLREIVRAPGPNLVLIACHRNDVADSAFVSGLNTMIGDLMLPVTRVELGPLTSSEARDLFTQVAGSSKSVALVEEAGGSPFFIHELTRYLVHHEPTAELSLRRCIEARFQTLAPQAQRLLYFLVLAGRPITKNALLEIADRDHAGLATAHDLANSGWIRAKSDADFELLESYHDRIRETLLDLVPRDERVATHLKIAEKAANQLQLQQDTKRLENAALDAERNQREDAREVRSLYQTALIAEQRTSPLARDIDPAFCFEQFLAGENTERAAGFGVAAAQEAVARFAFDQAATFYRQLIELHGSGGSFELWSGLGESLSKAGRAGEAARAQERALQFIDATSSLGLQLRTFIASEYLKGAELTEANRVLRDLLPHWNMELLNNPMIAWQRASRARLRLTLRTMLRGFTTKPKPSTGRFNILELCGLLQRLDSVNHCEADQVIVKILDEALRSGTPLERRYVLLHEGSRQAAIGGRYRDHCRRVLKAGIDLVRAEPHSGFEDFYTLFTIACLHHFLGQWRRSAFWWLATDRRLRKLSGGVFWERALADQFLAISFMYLGRLPELAERLASGMENAISTGNLWSQSYYETMVAPPIWLARGEPKVCLQRMNDAIGRLQSDTALPQHMWYAIGGVRAHLYEGETSAAWDHISICWPRIIGAGFLRLEGLSLLLHYERARAALAAATAEPDQANQRLAAARSSHIKIARSPLAHAAALSALIDASIEHREGTAPTLIHAFEHAAQLCDAADMPIMAHAAYVQIARIDPSPMATGRADAARGWFSERGVIDAERFADALVPPLPQ